jgi:hypothetical protein
MSLSNFVLESLRNFLFNQSCLSAQLVFLNKRFYFLGNLRILRVKMGQWDFMEKSCPFASIAKVLDQRDLCLSIRKK